MGISLKHIASTTCLTAMLAATPLIARANPTGGEVVAGGATITETGKKLDILQTTDRAVIDWRSFDIAPDEHTQFHQPDVGSIVLNRINSVNPSTIAGKLTANGNVILVNPNGVFFSRTSIVDVNGLVATSANIDTNKFMTGSLHFDKPGNPNAAIVNEGSITAKEAGLVGLVAPNVVNAEVINAKLGRVHLASGDTATLDLYGDGLMEVKASDALASQLVHNSGTINAAGGTIALTAAAGRASVNSVIHVTGELHSPTVGMRNGKIIIAAEGSNAVTGNIAANKGKKSGSSTVTIENALLTTAGHNAGERGGDISITGDAITLKGNTALNASGSHGGGTIHIGGEYQGKGTTAAARLLTVESGTRILADALDIGNGGNIILWSDNATAFYGAISARGGAAGGNGGFVETSGKHTLQALGRVDLAATGTGNAGTWLLDPADIAITNTDNNISGAPTFTATATSSQVSAATIKSSLDAGTHVTILTSNDGFAGNGDIYVNSGITTSGSGALTLSAYRSIIVNNPITLNGGALTLRANNADVGSGAIRVLQNIATNGGNITIGGGSGPISAGVGYAIGNSADKMGVYFSTVNTNAGGGNIIVNGQGWADASCHNNCFGVNYNGTYTTTGFGSISINGIGGGLGSTQFNSGINGSGTLTAHNGNITFTGSTTEAGGGGNAFGAGGTTVTTTGTGNISIIDTSAPGANGGSSYYNTANTFTSGGNFTYISNKLDYFGNYPTITAANDIIIRPHIAGTAMGIGAGVGASALNVSTTFLSNLTWGNNLWLGGYGNPGDGGYTSNAGLVTINTSHTFTKNVNFLSASGITHSGTSLAASGTANMKLNAGTGTVTANAISMGSGSLTFLADDLVLNNNLTGTGALTITPYSQNRAIRINTAGTGLSLSNAEIGRIQNGWSNIYIGRDDGTDTMYIGDSAWTDPITFRNNGSHTLSGALSTTDGASITFLNGWIDFTGSVTTNGGAFAITTNRPDASANSYDAGRLFAFNGSSINTNGGAISFQRFIPASGTVNVTGGAGGIRFNSLFDRSYSTSDVNVNLSATGGQIRFDSTADGIFGGGVLNLTATAASYLFNSAWGNTTPLGNVSLTSVASLTLPTLAIEAGKTLTAIVTGTGNSITTNSAIATGTNGNISFTADDLILGANLSGTGTLTLQPNSTSRNVRVNAGAGDFNLSTAELSYLADGWNQINIGRSNSVADAGIMHVGNGSTGTTWSDPVTFRNNGGFNLYNFTGTGNASLSLLASSGNDGIGLHGNITTAGGAVDFTGANGAYKLLHIQAGPTHTINTSGGAVSFNSIVFTNGSSDLTVNSGSGAITMLGVIRSQGALASNTTTTFNSSNTVSFKDVYSDTSGGLLNIIANAGSLAFTNAWGTAGLPLGNISLTSANTSFTLPNLFAAGNVVLNAGTGTITTGSIATGSGNLTLTADDLAIGGNLSGTGTLTLQPNSTSRIVRVNGSTGDFNLDNTEIGRLSDGWSGINIGRSDSSVVSYICTGADCTFTDPISFLSNNTISVGNVTGTGNASLSFGGGSSSTIDLRGNLVTAAQAVNMSTASYLFNNAGNHTITTSGGAFSAKALLINGSSGDIAINTGGGQINFITGSPSIADTGSPTNTKTITLNAGSGNISFAGYLQSAANLVLNSTGTITFSGALQRFTSVVATAGNFVFNSLAWGNIDTLGTVSLTSTNTNMALPTAITATGNVALNAGTGNITTGAIATGAGNLTLTADDLVLGGNLSGTGALTLQPYTTNKVVRVNKNAGDFNISTAELSYLMDNWSSITIGRADGTGDFWIGASNFSDPIIFRSGAANKYISGIVSTTDSAPLTIQGGTIQIFSDISTLGNISFDPTTYTMMFGGNITSNNTNINFNNSFYVSDGISAAINSGTGNVSFASNINGITPGLGNLTIVGNSMNFGGAVGNANPLGNVSLTSTTSLSLPSITASNILARTTGATSDITLASGRVLTASGTSNALTLAAGRNFINHAGSGALVMSGAGRWLVYSANPTDTLGEENLTSTFRRYSCAYASVGACAASGTLGTTIAIPGTGNGLIYSYTPTISATPDAQNVTYGDAATLNGYAYTLAGYLTGDTGDSVTGTLVGTSGYAQGMDIGSFGITYSSGTLASAMGYGITYANNTSAITVGKRTITASLTGTASKQYDTSDTATLGASNYSFSNFYAPDAGLVTGSAGSSTYNNANVGSGKNVSVTGLTLTGSKAGNYQLAGTSISGAIGTVTQAPLTVTAASQTITTNDTVPTGSFSYSGFAGSENSSVLDVLPTLSSARSGLVAAGTYAGNYTLSGGMDNNYSFNYISGTLTVTSAAAPITTPTTTTTTTQTVPTSVAYVSQRPIEVKTDTVHLELAPTVEFVVKTETASNSGAGQQSESKDTKDARREFRKRFSQSAKSMVIEISPALAKFLTMSKSSPAYQDI